jgi:hypothetical protein
MNISRSDLYRIVLEEYAKEEGMPLSEDRVEDLLAWIKGGKKPDDLDYARSKRTVPPAPQVPVGDIQGAETQAFPPADDMPSDDAPESEYSGFQDRSGPSDMSDDDIIASISQMIQGKDPEQVSELFQAVFSQIPGVEMGDAEEDPETLYSPGAEGRPAISLGPVREHLAAKSFEKILEMAGISWGSHSISGVPGNRDEDEEDIGEGHYHDMGDEKERYDVLDPEGFNDMADAELIDRLRADGLEEIIVFDREGDLANREEAIAALKDV